MGDSNPSTPHEGLLLLYSPVLFGVVSFIPLRLTVVILWPVFCLAVSIPCVQSPHSRAVLTQCVGSQCVCVQSLLTCLCASLFSVSSLHMCVNTE